MGAFTKEEVSRIWLSYADLPPVKTAAILAAYGSALDYFNAFSTKMWELLPLAAYNALNRLHEKAALLKELEKIHDLGIDVISKPLDFFDSLNDPPMLLYTLGDQSLLDQSKRIALIGTRKPTAYGRLMAQTIGETLAQNGVVVLSGFAQGIDTAALEGAINAGGKCVAFLGNGIGTAYPAENEGLYHLILDKGGLIVSEYPPGTSPYANHFPQRNRLISAAAHGVLFIEGEKKGGGMITVTHAMEQGKEVFVLPGPVNSHLYEAPHALIREGARLVTCAKDMMEDMGWEAEENTFEAAVTPEQDAILTVLKSGEASFEEIAEKTKQNPASLNSNLTIMEIAGIIKKSAGRIYMKIKR